MRITRNRAGRVAVGITLFLGFSLRALAGQLSACWIFDFAPTPLECIGVISGDPASQLTSTVVDFFEQTDWFLTGGGIAEERRDILILETLSGDVGANNQIRTKRCIFGGTPTSVDPLIGCAPSPAADTVKMTKNAGKPQQCGLKVCNPINVGTGNKYQREQDYLGTGPFPLRFERHYNSAGGIETRHVGEQWRHTYDRTVILGTGTATLNRADGRVLVFQDIASE